MSEYTPTTEDVAFYFVGEFDPQPRQEAFDRWLEEVQREAAEKAWWEACLRIADGENNLDIADTYQKQNPYLEEMPNE